MPLAGNVFSVSASCNVRWSYFTTKVDIQRGTGAQPLSTVIQRRRFSSLVHVARMIEGSDTSNRLVADCAG